MARKNTQVTEENKPEIQPEETPKAASKATSTGDQYKILSGTHFQDGRLYRVGEVIESDRNLPEIFGKLRFQKV